MDIFFFFLLFGIFYWEYGLLMDKIHNSDLVLSLLDQNSGC